MLEGTSAFFTRTGTPSQNLDFCRSDDVGGRWALFDGGGVGPARQVLESFVDLEPWQTLPGAELLSSLDKKIAAFNGPHENPLTRSPQRKLQAAAAILSVHDRSLVVDSCGDVAVIKVNARGHTEVLSSCPTFGGRQPLNWLGQGNANFEHARVTAEDGDVLLLLSRGVFIDSPRSPLPLEELAPLVLARDPASIARALVDQAESHHNKSALVVVVETLS